MTLRIIEVKTAEDTAYVRDLFLAYIQFIEEFLGQNLDFQNTKEEFETFPQMYAGLFLAILDDVPVGACGLKAFAPNISELKRLYVAPAGRGHAIGESLVHAAISFSVRNGFESMYLDTDPGLRHANRIYEKLGFVDIDRYYDNPMGCSRYMALKHEVS